jgi:hypothetical protein
MKGTGNPIPLLIILFLIPLNMPLMGADLESPEFYDLLLSLPDTEGPQVFQDAVIFTSPSLHRRAGVALAAEGFATVHWMRKLLISQDPLEAPAPGKKAPDPYKDSGLLFYVYEPPEGLTEIEYRLVLDGLWTIDPANPLNRRDRASGITNSLVILPPARKEPVLHENPRGILNFSFKGPPGETVTVAGSFNYWDPFMYELREYPEGVYTLGLALPPGTYQYLFFHRGERYLDPYNSRRAYTREGEAASEVVIE